MAFRPVGEDHAVEAIAFVAVLSHPLGPDQILALSESRDDWKKGLPAVRPFGPQGLAGHSLPTPGLNITVGPAPGIVFAYMRPDGIDEWRLQCGGDSVVVLCTKYTRWRRVWDRANELFVGVFRTLGTTDKNAQPTFTIKSLMMEVADRFISSGEEYLVSEVLDPGSKHVAPYLLESGKLWHMHGGYFEERSSGRTLVQFRIDALEQAGEFSLRIQHNQTVNRGEPPIQADLDGEEGFLRDTMNELHLSNKDFIRDLLSVDMQKAISLDKV